MERMSDAESYIMQCFWKSGELKSEDVAAMVAEKNWKQTTLLTFLSRLVQKGMLSVRKEGRSNLYQPLISEKEYKQHETKQFLDDMYQGSTKSFLAAMVDGNGLNKEDIDEIRDWLKEQETIENK